MAMRFKYIILTLMLLIMVTSVTAVAAADDYESLGDYTFDIPDGYHVEDKSDNMLKMSADDNHSIIVYKLDASEDVDFLKSLAAGQGCEFGEEENFTSGNFNVRQCTYNYTDIQGMLYLCDDGKGNPIFVGLLNPNSEEAPDPINNPARQVVDSLE